MKNSVPFVLLLLLITTACFQPERNCTDFKTGTFEFEAEVNGVKEKTTFFRNDSTKLTIIKVWPILQVFVGLSDCEYILTKLHPKITKSVNLFIWKILTTKGDTYVFEFSMVGDAENKHKGTVKKLE